MTSRPCGRVVGVHDLRTPPNAADLAAMGHAIAGLGSVASFVDGPFAVAWFGSPSVLRAERGGVFALVDGRLWDHDSGDHRHVAHALSTDLTGFLRRSRGDFAVVVHDARTGRGTLARDHLGAGSMVWTRRGSRVVFASEVVDLLRLLPSRPAPDEVALSHWLAASGMPGDRTLYEGIRRVPAAHRLDFGPHGPVATRYWSPVYRRPARLDRVEAAAALRTHLTVAVRRRSDAASGVLLSGGLDSSTVAALAADLDEPIRPRRSYSAVFPNHPTVDESALIDKLCSSYDLDATHAVVRSGSVLAGAVEYLGVWDLPPTSPNLFFWLPLLRRAASDGVHALLDGEGGDEIFGLSPYLLADRLRRGRVRAARALVRQIPGLTDRPSPAFVSALWREYCIKGAVPASVHEAVRRRRGGRAYTPRWLRAEVADAFLDGHAHAAWKRLDGPRWWAYLVDTVTRGMGTSLLHDHVRQRAAMCGLESRHPLVDVDVIEYVLGLQPELAWDARWSRPLVREALAARLPDEVRLRFAKSNFDAVFHEALTGPDLGIVRRLLSRDAPVGAYVDLDAVQRDLLAAPPPAGGRQHWAIDVWRLVTADLWLRAQHEGLERGLGDLALAAADVEITANDASRMTRDVVPK